MKKTAVFFLLFLFVFAVVRAAEVKRFITVTGRKTTTKR